MIEYSYILLGILFIISIIDLKFRQIPSILLSGVLFVTAFLSFYFNPSGLTIGILSLIFAIILFEADFIGGIGDIKVIVVIGLMLNSLFALFWYVLLIMIFGIIWKMIIKWRYKAKEYAFIPVLFFVLLTLIILGYTM